MIGDFVTQYLGAAVREPLVTYKPEVTQLQYLKRKSYIVLKDRI